MKMLLALMKMEASRRMKMKMGVEENVKSM
jgi:hypothetical protein